MNISDITYYQVPDFSPKEFARKLSSLIVEVRKEKKKENVVFLCIGSDRSTGDSLGPITGYLLQKNGCFSTVLGTLKEPVHAINLEEALTQIETEHRDSVIVAIDASIGKKEHVGSITIGKGSIKPGLGVKKDLSEVGDIFITGIVGASGRFEPLLLQNTRLSVVMGLAECIYEGILLSNTFAELVP